MSDYIIYTDGGSRGNPGPAAIGFVIEDGRGRALKEYGETIGKATNNIAEYKALVLALKKLKAIIGGEKAAKAEVEVRADSELLMKQLNGEYKLKDAGLMPLFIEIWNIKQDFKDIVFVHVPREENKVADRMVNDALDGKGDQEALL
ncbi:MAG: hypothetical protein A3A80_03050 [Candidatus Terrybacteria bacterium RIFCSPLOWO2_01_FULL_44_24]|uniref:RNase H type-1 domain-containing protein n=1 Tax=Candidatus Terrybacteria bacterium RIFCSPHIGHO2_01_FULL_43_35 TaxID=1802361 RepID=A0A1G2PEL9_9BACT|nr:MAG: hypothetical protein A2828_00605 [Candidatus Terrybacteria bacterium RIFCSPHIGHO2_01_FULL_43_35]OHA49408.1 MAG: hypothetical protein A3B75_02835 [Candidatus Terrybacteria bacterium RIFCSPHIGHO2_02_FULL_43_14]OHA51632.1 MAG: hypothetical protein A3A80_03050 [Candidatus Terrybacteria bacterium RIFCSPLOWO2_01_FULL_44_24]